MHPISLIAGLVAAAFTVSLVEDIVTPEPAPKPPKKKAKKKVAKSVPIPDNSGVPQPQAQNDETDNAGNTGDVSSGANPETSGPDADAGG